MILEDVCQDYVCQLMHYVLKEADIRVLPGTIEHVPDVIAVKLKMKSIFNCNSLILQKSKLLSCIDANCTQFKTLDNKNKPIWLMNNENKDVLLELCNVIKNNEKHT